MNLQQAKGFEAPLRKQSGGLFLGEGNNNISCQAHIRFYCKNRYKDLIFQFKYISYNLIIYSVKFNVELDGLWFSR